MSKLFGTDSTRGIAVAGISCELAMQAGRAAAVVFSSGKDKKSKIIVAKDKSRSSDILEAAVCAGICSAGADAEELGVIPAAAAALLVKEHNADAGIMISAAYGSARESGIRIFNEEGLRPDAADEILTEKLALGSPDSPELKCSEESGAILRFENAAEEYAALLKGLVSPELSGMKIAVDCTDSCAVGIAERLFSESGAEVLTVPEQYSDSDIDAAATPLERLMDHVTENECDCGFAFDNDGTGCIAVDENGKPVSGDSLLAIFALDFRKKGILRHNSVVAPLTSSMGLMSYLTEHEIGLVTTGAADRYAAYRMREGGYNLGGEKSGHILFSDFMPLEDGLFTALKLLEIMKSSGKRLSELSDDINTFPQVVLNVRIAPRKREIWKNDREITGLIEQMGEALGDEGRIIVCENSTAAPSIRVIAEGSDFSRINNIAMTIARTIKKRCGKP